MKKIGLTLLLILLTSYLPQALAQDKGTVVGEGAKFCKKFAKTSGRKLNDYIVWLQGYVSAYNSIAPGILDVMANHDYHWAKEKLLNYCKAHPEEYFNDAVVALMRELHPEGIRLGGPSVSIAP